MWAKFSFFLKNCVWVWPTFVQLSSLFWRYQFNINNTTFLLYHCTFALLVNMNICQKDSRLPSFLHLLYLYTIISSTIRKCNYTRSAILYLKVYNNNLFERQILYSLFIFIFFTFITCFCLIICCCQHLFKLMYIFVG